MPLALSNGDAILIIVLVAIPVGAITFVVGAGNALRQVGKGQFGVEFEHDLPNRPRDAHAPSGRDELRQLLEAKSYRQQRRGGPPLDVEAELERLMRAPAGEARRDVALRAEVRQLVLARNERRLRRGKEPLDVEAEVERQLRDLESLGQ